MDMIQAQSVEAFVAPRLPPPPRSVETHRMSLAGKGAHKTGSAGNLIATEGAVVLPGPSHG